MNHVWPAVPLGEVLKHRKEFIYIDDSQEYKRCRIQLHAKGIVLRDIIEGARIKTKEQQVCRSGEFLVAEIDAKVGGFGLVPEDLDRAIVSSHYFLFEIDQVKLDKGFLDYYIRTPTFRDQVSARGTTNYAAIRPRQVLEYLIPLPPLPEQRRIVAKIEVLAARIEEARGLRNQSVAESEALILSKRAIIFNEALQKKSGRFDNLATLERGKFSHRPRNDPRFFGGSHPWIQIGEIESSGKYIRHWSQTLNDEGLSISRKFPKGTLLISIAATIGAVGILDFDCCIPDSIVAVTQHPGCDSEFIYHYLCFLRTHLEKIAPQSAQKNINLQILCPLPIPDLPEAEQRRIVAYLDGLEAQVDPLKKLQAQTAAELDALLPAILDRAFKGEL